MKSTTRVPGDIPLISIRVTYNSRKVLGFIATEGAGSTEPGDPYLSCLPDIFSCGSVCHVVQPPLPQHLQTKKYFLSVTDDYV